MQNPFSLSDLLTYCTIRIEAEGTQGKSYGSGFFFEYNINNLNVPVIVTNKHVIQGTSLGKLIFSQSDDSGNRLLNNKNYTIENFEEKWIKHPNAAIDLCIFPIAHIIKDLRNSNFNPHFSKITPSIIPTDEQLSNVFSLEEIVMVGYPNGIWDK